MFPLCSCGQGGCPRQLQALGLADIDRQTTLAKIRWQGEGFESKAKRQEIRGLTDEGVLATTQTRMHDMVTSTLEDLESAYFDIDILDAAVVDCIKSLRQPKAKSGFSLLDVQQHGVPSLWDPALGWIKTICPNIELSERVGE
ncbi:hypothetical protein BGZ73_000544, partial [Actinomortierella ambigua]